MKLPTEILALAETNSLEPAAFAAWCKSSGLGALEAANNLALEIARQYVAGQLDYVFCDRVMNCLSIVVWSEEFFELSDRKTPKVLDEVFLAFDEGEYVHPGDIPSGDSEAKYTKPMVAKILEQHNVA